MTNQITKESARKVISKIRQYLGEKGATTKVRIAIEMWLDKGDLLCKSQFLYWFKRRQLYLLDYILDKGIDTVHEGIYLPVPSSFMLRR